MDDFLVNAEFVNDLNKVVAKFKKAGVGSEFAALSVAAVMQKHYPAADPAKASK